MKDTLIVLWRAEKLSRCAVFLGIFFQAIRRQTGTSILAFSGRVRFARCTYVHMTEESASWTVLSSRHREAAHAATLGNAKNGHVSRARTCYREYTFQILSKNKCLALAAAPYHRFRGSIYNFFRERGLARRRIISTMSDTCVAVNYGDKNIFRYLRVPSRGRVRSIRAPSTLLSLRGFLEYRAAKCTTETSL